MKKRSSFIFYLLSFLCAFSPLIPIKAINIQQIAVKADLQNSDQIEVILEYKLNISSELDQDIPVKVLCHKGIIPENIQVIIGGQDSNLALPLSDNQLLGGTFSLESINTLDSLIDILITYNVTSLNQEEVIIPLLLIDAKPTTSEFNTFSAEITLPKAFEIFEMFPFSDLEEIEKGSNRIYSMNLQVIPSWVCVKLQPLGSNRLSFNFFVDIIVIALLVMAGFVAWKGLGR